MIKNRYQYIFAIVLLMLLHVSIMFFWLGNIKQPSNLNALNSNNKTEPTSQTNPKPFKFYFINY